MRFLLQFLLGVALLWMLAFGVFLARMEAPADAPEAHTDALVVLTGSSNRLEHGFELLARGAAPVLYISGVGKNAKVSELLPLHTTAAVRQKISENGGEIILDHVATSTQMNAAETQAFIRARHYKTVRLITAHYHMPRSLVEFHAVLPDVRFLAEPVLSDQFEHAIWWKNPSTRRVVLQEFHKYLAAHVRVMVQ